MLTLAGDVAATCKGTYSQSGSSLSTNMVCEAYGTVSQAGTIDPSTGSYNLTGEVTVGETTYQVETLGTASPDGNTVGGTWSVPTLKLSGTFAGIRQSDPQDPPCSILHPCRPPEMPTATPAPGTPPATAKPSSAALALPETGASRPASSVSRESLTLLAVGAAALALGGAAWHARRRWVM